MLAVVVLVLFGLLDDPHGFTIIFIYFIFVFLNVPSKFKC